MGNMGGHDQSQKKSQKSLKKYKSVPNMLPKSHNDDTSDTSDPARNRYCTSFPSQDSEAGISGRRNVRRVFDSLLTFFFLDGQCGTGVESPRNPNPSDRGGCQEELSGGPDHYQRDLGCN